jgi:isopentenyl-diphosphate Delta-isomerase
MKKVTPISSRKTDHIRINLEEDVQSRISTGLEHYRFLHRALPEINLEDIDISLTMFGKRLRAPLLISSMTGGSPEAQKINQTLAQAAQEAQIAIGVGSMRAALEHPELAPSFQIRHLAPDVLLFANLGAIQLNYGYGIKECLRAVEMIEADALILHFNALQEAVQPEGDTRFAGLLAKVESICRTMPVPVIAKEVGWGFSERDVINLANAGVSAIDVAGAGGTSWSQVEAHRSPDEDHRKLASAFISWGIPTAEAIKIARTTAPQLILFASGGLRSGIDIAKCIALGADLGGMAAPFLKAATESLEKTIKTIEITQQEIKISMFAAGIADMSQLKTYSLQYS